MSTDRSRQPPGIPSGGRFAASAHSETELTLTPLEELAPTLHAAADADAASLPAFARHPDPEVRAEASTNLACTEELRRELSADPDWVVRLTVAQLPNAGVAERASRDQHPVVRLAALRNGWDLSDASRSRLEADPEIAKVRAALTMA